MASNRNQDIASVLLRYDVDERSVSDSVKAADAVLKRYKALASDAGALRDAVSQVRQAQDLHARGMDAEGIAAQRAARNLQDVIDRTKEAAAAARRGRSDVDEYGRAYKRAAQEVESFGDISTNISQISGLARSVGLGGLADILGTGADVTDAIEGIGRIGPALQDAGGKARDAIANITGLDMSLGQLAAVGGGAAVAAAAVVAGVSALFNRIQETAEAYRKQEEARRAGEMAARESLADMTTAEREAETERIRSALNAQNGAVLDYTQQAIALAEELRGQTGPAFQLMHGEIRDGIQTLQEAQTIFDELGGYGALNLLSYGLQLDETTQRAVQALGTYINSAKDAAGQVDQLGAQLVKLTDTQADTIVSTNDAAEAELALAEARGKGENAARAALTAAARAADEAAARNVMQASLDALDAARELARFEKELAGVRSQSRSSSSNLRDAARQRVDALEAQYTKAEETANQAIAKIQSDTGKKRGEIEREFMAESIKATREYLAEEARYEDAAARERVRRTEDMLESQLQAQEDNDVIAFIRATRSGQKDLRRMAEDADVAAKQRAEDFAAEQDQRTEEQKVRVADLKSDADERIAEIRRGLQEQRQTTDEQIRQENAALKERLRLNRSALVAELDIRRKAHAIGLAEEAAYSAQRLAIQQNLDSAMLAIANRTYSGAALKSTGYTAALSKTYASTRTITPAPAGGLNLVVNMGNIGSDLSRAEVNAGFTAVGKAVLGAVVKGTGGK